MTARFTSNIEQQLTKSFDSFRKPTLISFYPAAYQNMKILLIIASLLTFRTASSAAYVVGDKNNLLSKKKILEVVKPATPPVHGGGGAAPNKDQAAVAGQTKMTVAVDHKKTASSVGRKKWGMDNNNEDEYWFDDRIHSLGNTGIGGAIHAAIAPLSTKVIDILSYDGVDVRSKVNEHVTSIPIEQLYIDFTFFS